MSPPVLGTLTARRTAILEGALRKCLNLAERLYGMVLEEDEIPEQVARSMERVLGGLRQVVGDQ